MMAAAISFVVVFPELPVMATTGIENRARQYRARSPRAVSVSSTEMTVISPAIFSRRLSRPLWMRTPAAPAPAACPM